MAQNQNVDRLTMALIGAVGGLAAWILIDVLPDEIENARIILTLAAFCGAFFAGLLVAIGPLSLPRAAVAALCVSVVPTLLLLWASFRFAEVEEFLRSGHSVTAFFVLASIPLPFLFSAMGPDRNWIHYPALFSHAWNIVVRYAVAWVFVGVFWGVVFLSDELLKIVGLQIIEDLLDVEPVPFFLTGASLGLAMAVVHELRAYVSPYLVLRLLRLLLPVVLLVVAIFVVAVPIRGISGLFGNLSAAAVLMSMAIAAVSLITTAIDQTDEEAVAPGLMRKLIRILGLLLPILAGLAVYAIWLRVGQYGWSPNRIAAATIAFFVLIYSLAYAVAMIRGADWMQKIRTVNILMAGLHVAVAVLLLSPILNLERISAKSQLARYQSGKTGLNDLDLWAIGREWGVAGEALLQQFVDAQPENAAKISEQIALLEETEYEHVFRQKRDVPDQERIEEFRELVPVRPLGKELPNLKFVDFPNHSAVIDSCKRRTPSGNPVCAAILADLLPDVPGEEVMLVWSDPVRDTININMWAQAEDGVWTNHWAPKSVGALGPWNLGLEDIDKLLAGEYSIKSIAINSLSIGDAEFYMTPN